MGISWLIVVHLAASLLTLANAAAKADVAKVLKASKPTRPALDVGCTGFLKKPKAFGKEVSAKCCQQEINCQQSHCLGEVLGPLRVGYHVRVKTDFVSDDLAKQNLTKGLEGRVLSVDKEGDAYINFTRTEISGGNATHEEKNVTHEFLHHWVFWQNSWEVLEVKGRGARHSATKATKCLDSCMMELQCLPFNEASKKEQESFQTCLKSCNLDDCHEDEDCKPYLDKYHECKQTNRMCFSREEGRKTEKGKRKARKRRKGLAGNPQGMKVQMVREEDYEASEADRDQEFTMEL